MRTLRETSTFVTDSTPQESEAPARAERGDGELPTHVQLGYARWAAWGSLEARRGYGLVVWREALFVLGGVSSNRSKHARGAMGNCDFSTSNEVQATEASLSF